MKQYILDANALVRLYRDTPGAETVERLIREAKAGQAQLGISAVNLTEVCYTLTHFLGEVRTHRCLQDSRQAILPHGIDEESAIRAASIRTRYKLGLADCYAAELAIRTGATLVTADPEFARLGRKLKVLALPRHRA
jgi:predicted nucleic acid-binding protein